MILNIRNLIPPFTRKIFKYAREVSSQVLQDQLTNSICGLQTYDSAKFLH
jgi:hypothetical protein